MNGQPIPPAFPDAQALPDPAWARLQRDDPQRIRWLFRDALRQHEIHPLMRLILAHRQRAAADPAKPAG
ncbi:MAG TPA: hypothetical protein VGQ91_16410 [Ideonella sp.]|jgi:hypothetical protein|nr:hypothetical protein [Ideonella sp.]